METSYLKADRSRLADLGLELAQKRVPRMLVGLPLGPGIAPGPLLGRMQGPKLGLAVALVPPPGPR